MNKNFSEPISILYSWILSAGWPAQFEPKYFSRRSNGYVHFPLTSPDPKPNDLNDVMFYFDKINGLHERRLADRAHRITSQNDITSYHWKCWIWKNKTFSDQLYIMLSGQFGKRLTECLSIKNAPLRMPQYNWEVTKGTNTYWRLDECSFPINEL